MMEPFTRLLDLTDGLLDRHDPVVERRLSDMAGMYLDGGEAPDRLLYRVYPVSVPETADHLQCSTTVLEPGTVGGEYHMTKGHFHEVRGRSEVYLGLSGQGRLVLTTEDGRTRVEPLERGSLSYVPGGWAHRSVNVGAEPLVFLAVYVGDAGHDYATIEQRGFPVVVVAGDDGPAVEPNPRWQG